MKIDARQRSHAKRIANSTSFEVGVDVSEKAQRFGLIAQSAGSISVKQMYSDIAVSHCPTMGALNDTVRNVAGRHITEAFKLSETTTIDELYARRYLVVGNTPDKNPTERRLAAGLAVGITFQSLTLNTIRYYCLRSCLMTRAGLLASGRIPFSAAMMHGDDLSAMNKVIQACDTQSEFDFGLNEQYIRFNEDAGLSLEGTGWPKQPDVPPKNFDDEQIGCPMTLIPKFIETIHAAAVDAAIANGLIWIKE